MKIAINTSEVSNGDIDFSEFEALGEVKYFGTLSRDELKATVRDCDALIVNKIVVDEDLLSVCPQLKYVGVFATGYNQLDLKACSAHGVTVCNVPDYSTNAVSQHAFALLLSLYESLRDYTLAVDGGEWIKSKTFTFFPYPIRELDGKTFGVYGYGNIGKKVAKIAEAFGMNVIICTRTPPVNCPYKVVSKDEIFAISDVLSLHCPLTEQTKGLVNTRTLSLMKSDAVLINTARGGLVEEQALADALNSGRLGGAGLDVVDVEPMRADNPLFRAKNCLITPHIAWVPHETRTRLVHLAAGNLRAFIEGHPTNKVN